MNISHAGAGTMTRHLIIDGYNLLGAKGQLGSAGAGEQAREQLLRELQSYRQRKPHPVTIVFDGWQQGLGVEHGEHRAGVEVVYSRRGERADQVIQRLVDQYGGDCAVVSSDREVADFARGRGAFVMSAPEFWNRLRSEQGGAGDAGFRRRPTDEDDVPLRRPAKKGNPRKLPKSVRKRNRLMRGF